MYNAHSIEDSVFRSLAAEATPTYAYSLGLLRTKAELLMTLTAPFGLTSRYAVKANTHPRIIQLFNESGLHFDASSSYEATALLHQGIPGEAVSLSSQQPAHNLNQLLEAGVRYIATSLHQLSLFADIGAYKEVGLRVNPGVGSGHNKRTTTGGVGSSFGVWHEYVPEALGVAARHGIHITTLHVHIGSGADPTTWGNAMEAALRIAEIMPDVTILDIGGGYKVQRVKGEQETDMAEVLKVFSEKLQYFAERTGRTLHLEIEPGTWLVAQAGFLIAEVVDIVDTGKEGYSFLRINTGMNDFLRPAMYGAQHTIRLLNSATGQQEYVIVGHNCETGDILSPAPGDPEGILPRSLPTASIGDAIVIEDVGAYCASMSAKGYNSFPSAREVIID